MALRVDAVSYTHLDGYKRQYLQDESDVASLLQARSRLNQFTTPAYSRHILALYE